jgi:hypothetical protein
MEPTKGARAINLTIVHVRGAYSPIRASTVLIA